MFASRFRLGLVLGINQTLSWSMTFYLPAIVAGPVAGTFSQSAFAVLGAFSWSFLVTGACAPRAGRWIDGHGGRGALLVSIVVMAAGQVMLALSQGLGLWYLGWTVIGVGMSMGLYDAAFATVAGLFGKEAGPSITGITLVAGFASTVFWTFGAALIGSLGWRGLRAV
jgi:MFS family permease